MGCSRRLPVNANPSASRRNSRTYCAKQLDAVSLTSDRQL
jgi:hypothetical protein